MVRTNGTLLNSSLKLKGNSLKENHFKWKAIERVNALNKTDNCVIFH